MPSCATNLETAGPSSTPVLSFFAASFPPPCPLPITVQSNQNLQAQKKQFLKRNQIKAIGNGIHAADLGRVDRGETGTAEPSQYPQSSCLLAAEDSSWWWSSCAGEMFYKLIILLSGSSAVLLCSLHATLHVRYTLSSPVRNHARSSTFVIWCCRQFSLPAAWTSAGDTQVLARRNLIKHKTVIFLIISD